MLVWHAHAHDDDKVRLLPLKNRSLRVISESFRYIVKHIQTFSSSKLSLRTHNQAQQALHALGSQWTNDAESLGDPHSHMQQKYMLGYKEPYSRSHTIHRIIRISNSPWFHPLHPSLTGLTGLKLIFTKGKMSHAWCAITWPERRVSTSSITQESFSCAF